jgi:hypothetical protein
MMALVGKVGTGILAVLSVASGQCVSEFGAAFVVQSVVLLGWVNFTVGY